VTTFQKPQIQRIKSEGDNDMKWLPRVTTILFLLLTLNAVPAQTQTSPETFSSFWKTFKAAITKNDKQAVADLTKLPFTVQNKDYDRAGFIKIYSELFPQKLRRCIATAKPLKEGDGYEIFCGDQILGFGTDSDGKYKFLWFGAND
jgi:hypothetical protein